MRDDFPLIDIYYFTETNCSVCKVLKPKIDELIKREFPPVKIETIDVKEDPITATKFSVFTIPVLLILVEKKEHYRFVRNFSLNEVEEKLKRLVELIG